LTTDAGDYEAATTHFAAALALAEACAAPYERALTQIARAALLARMGDAAGATAALDAARAVCEPLGAAPALARADALAIALAAPVAAHSSSAVLPYDLTAREVEVLRLLAAGMTNPQIADDLYLSPRTVGQHLRSIFRKLDVNTRSAATRFAMERGLV